MTTIILLRHGESEANHLDIFAGQIDPGLHDNGVAQAQLAAKYIAEEYKVDKIYASDLKRAYNTALPLAKMLGMEISKEKGMREICAGKWEGAKYYELPKLYPEEFELWLNHTGLAKCPDGESVAELGERVMNTLTAIAKENDGKTVVVATHATPIRVMQCLVENGSLSGMEKTPWVTNASLTIFEYENNVWHLVEASRDIHLKGFVTELPENV